MTVEDDLSENSSSNNLKRIYHKLKTFLWKYHIVFLLLIGLTVGLTWSTPGAVLSDASWNFICFSSTHSCVWNSVSSLCVSIIFLISGLSLNILKAKIAFRSGKLAIVFGFIMVIFITSIWGYIIAASKPYLNPIEFSKGLSIFLVLPTTLATSVLVTDLSKGDVAMALFLVISTNLLGVFIVPFQVTLVFQVFEVNNHNTSTIIEFVAINPVPMILSLIFTVLIPLLFGIMCQIVSMNVRKFVSRYSNYLKFISSLALACVPWMKVSQSSSSFLGVGAIDIVVLIFCVIGIHLVLLFMVYTSARFIGKFKLDFVKAITFAGAQKSLPICFSIIDEIPTPLLGNPGLVALPVILIHLFQTIFDAALAAKWAELTEDKISSSS